MEVVVKCVNEFRAKGLKHRQFQSFLEEVNAQYEYLIHYSEIRMLIRWRVFAFLEELETFLIEREILCF